MGEKLKKLVQEIGVLSISISIVFVLVMGLAIANGAWSEPDVAPPDGNIGAPINIGLNAQNKAGALGVSGILSALGGLVVGEPTGSLVTNGIRSEGDICTDEDGGKCLSSAGSGGGGNNCKVLSGRADAANNVCKSVTFSQSFSNTPIVMATPEAGAPVAIKNISTTGFEACGQLYNNEYYYNWTAFDCLSAGSGGSTNMQVFDSNGNFTVPSGVTKIMVEVWGGGAGGAGGCGYGGGAGGGGGGYAMDIFNVSSGDNYTMTVGNGGGARAVGTSSSFGTNVVASGGGIPEKCNSIGGIGGEGTAGANKIGGGDGGAAPNDDSNGYNQGANGGSAGNGGGGGTGGSAYASATAGKSGHVPGGGGGGGSSNGAGGSGAGGRVIVRW